MKTQKAILLSLFLSISTMGQSQISKTINCTAGNLDALLGGSKSVVTSLTLTGSIDARDFNCMTNLMTSLLDLDISAVTIKAYKGGGGTHQSYNNVYLANEIPSYAFYVNSPSILRSIILPNSLTSIADEAFWAHKKLADITLPNSLISIGKNAFLGNPITKIILPEGLKIIETGAFSETLIETITIPNSVISLGEFVFGSIETGVFSKCSNLKSIILPNSLTAVSNEMFRNCKNLTNITIPNTVIYIGSYAFEGCTSLTNIVFSSSVKTLNGSNFKNCTKLKSIVLGENITTIGDLTFDGCSNLSSITVRNRKPIDFTKSPNVFRGVDKTNCILYVPLGTKADYQTNVVWMDFKNIVESTTDISSLTTTSINIFPNPTAESFVLNGLEEEAKVQVIDLNGKILLTQKVDNTEKVFVNTLRNGVYIVKIITAQQAIEQKIIKY